MSRGFAKDFSFDQVPVLSVVTFELTAALIKFSGAAPDCLKRFSRIVRRRLRHSITASLSGADLTPEPSLIVIAASTTQCEEEDSKVQGGSQFGNTNSAQVVEYYEMWRGLVELRSAGQPLRLRSGQAWAAVRR